MAVGAGEARHSGPPARTRGVRSLQGLQRCPPASEQHSSLQPTRVDSKLALQLYIAPRKAQAATSFHNLQPQAHASDALAATPAQPGALQQAESVAHCAGLRRAQPAWPALRWPWCVPDARYAHRPRRCTPPECALPSGSCADRGCAGQLRQPCAQSHCDHLGRVPSPPRWRAPACHTHSLKVNTVTQTPLPAGVGPSALSLM